MPRGIESLIKSGECANEFTRVFLPRGYQLHEVVMASLVFATQHIAAFRDLRDAGKLDPTKIKVTLQGVDS